MPVALLAAISMTSWVNFFHSFTSCTSCSLFCRRLLNITASNTTSKTHTQELVVGAALIPLYIWSWNYVRRQNFRKIHLLMWFLHSVVIILSRVLSARGKNKRGFSGLNKGVYLNYFA
jgi:hypothetical protein